MLKTLKQLAKNWRDRLFSNLATKADIDRLYGLLAGLQQIHNAMDGKPVLKPMRGWAISPDSMAIILADLQERGPSTVLEFGSGQSTIIFAAILKRRGGRLISVDHDLEYADKIRAQLRACGLDDIVTFFHAPLADQKEKAEAFISYDLLKMPPLEIDVALIDGPPYLNGELTRFTPLDWAARHLTKDGVIFLDDFSRTAEQRCFTLLKSRHSNVLLNELAVEKGLASITLPK
jgi:predicted O-methyltransferase YrrM